MIRYQIELLLIKVPAIAN